MTGLPWSHPDADPMADLRDAWEQDRRLPPPLELRVSEPFERALHGSAARFQRTQPQAFRALMNVAGWPIIRNNNLPPGWAVLVDPARPGEVLEVFRLEGVAAWPLTGPHRLERGIAYMTVDPPPALGRCPVRPRPIRRVYVVPADALEAPLDPEWPYQLIDADSGALLRYSEERMARATFVPVDAYDADREVRLNFVGLAEALPAMLPADAGGANCPGGCTVHPWKDPVR